MLARQPGLAACLPSACSRAGGPALRRFRLFWRRCAGNRCETAIGRVDERGTQQSVFPMALHGLPMAVPASPVMSLHDQRRH